MGLITQEIEIQLNGNNMEWFKNKGYEIPKIKNKWGELTTPQKTKIIVKVEDLKNNSLIKVDVQCDNCGKISPIMII